MALFIISSLLITSLYTFASAQEVGNDDTSEHLQHTAPPSAPENVNSVPGERQITVSWDAVSDATSYEIRWRAAGRDTTLTAWEDIGNTTTHTITDLFGGIKHVVHIRAKNTAGVSERVIINFSRDTTPPTMLPAPTNAASVPGKNQLTISWDPVLGATSYELRWRDDIPALNPWEYTDVGDVTTYTITGLASDSLYTIQLRAKNATTVSERAIVKFSNKYTRPIEPTGVPTNAVVTPGDGQLTVSWDAVSDATSYEIRWRAAGQSAPEYWEYLNIGTTTTHTITGLTNGVKHVIHVRAKNGYRSGKKAVIGFNRSTRPNPAG